MTDKLLIERELLEQVASEFEHDNDRYMLGRELRKVLAAPRQPDGDELEVVGWRHCADRTKLLCNLGKQRAIPGDYADEFTIPLCSMPDAQRAIAELREECDTLRQQIAERDAELKKVKADRASCWAEFKVMTRSCLEAEAQRDKLAGLLREVRGYTDSPHIVGIIDAALADLNT